jgi:hypothetical protein
VVQQDGASACVKTQTPERQNRVVALRKVNILDAAPTDRHVGGASRMAGIIEQEDLLDFQPHSAQVQPESAPQGIHSDDSVAITTIANRRRR